MEHRLSDKWIRAAITGTVWAASEIVLGSFLHNLKIPFSGNLLTAIGIIILISFSYQWKGSGLFWRAGLVCALMKTMSPSAVIFGPMIAIFSEGMLMEIFTRVLGRNRAGYITGAMAAMSWNLLQKIFNMIIFYGSGIVDVYTSLLKMAQKQLNIQNDMTWIPVIILFVLYAIFGLVAAVAGIMTGKRIDTGAVIPETNDKPESEYEDRKGGRPSFNHSLSWLFINIGLMALAFFLLNTTKWPVWGSTVIIIAVVWSLRYSRAMRQMSRPKFWMVFVLITILTAIAFSGGGNGTTRLYDGLMTGIQMNFRAVIIIMGFSVTGTELYNPVIRNYFMGTKFRNLPLALELSAETLPLFIKLIPDFKTLMKNPVSVLSGVLAHAENRLQEIQTGNDYGCRLFLVTGKIEEGKTSYIKKLEALLRKSGIKTAGLISERIVENSVTTGYLLRDIETGEEQQFLSSSGQGGPERIGRFFICRGGLELGNKVLSSLTGKRDMVIFIDEVGSLELSGRGWATSIDALVTAGGNKIVMTVRDKFAMDVSQRWGRGETTILNVKGITPEEGAARII